MKRRRRLRPRAGIALAVGLVLALPVAAGWFPQAFLRTAIEGALRTAVGPEARLGGLKVVPGLLSAEVRDLHLEGPGWALDLPEGHFALSPGALLGGVPSLRALALRRPHLQLRPVAETGDAAADGTPPAFPLLVSRFALTEGRVEWLGDPSVSIEGLEATGSLGEGSVELRSNDVRLFADPARRASLEAGVSVASDLSVAISRLELQYAGSRLSLSGELGASPAAEPRFDARASLDLETLAAALELPASSGALEVTAALRAGRRYEASASSGVVDVAGWPLDGLDLSVSGEGEAGRLTLDARGLGGRLEARARMGEGRVDGDLLLEGVDTERVSRARGDLGLPPGRIEGRLEFAGPVPGDLAVQGRVGFRSPNGALDLAADLTGSADPVAPRLDLGLRASADARAPVPGVELGPVRRAALTATGRAQGGIPPGVEADVQGSFAVAAADEEVPIDLEGALRHGASGSSADLRLRVAGAPVAAQGELQPSGAARVRLQAADLLLAPLHPDLEGRAAVELVATRDARGVLEAEGHADLAALVWNAVELGAADVEVAASAGRATLVATLPSLGLRLEVDVPVPEADPADLLLRLDETPLDLAARLAGGPDVRGVLSGTGRARVERARPLDATAELRVESAEVASGPWEGRLEAPLELRWEGRRLAINGLDLSAVGLRVSGTGTLGLEPGDAVEAELEIVGDLAQAPLPEGWSAAGTVDLSADVAGTRLRPEVRGDALLRDVLVSGPDLPPLVLERTRLELAGDAVSLPGTRAELLGGSVELQGRLPLAALLPDWRAAPGPPAPAERADLTLRWSGLDAASVIGAARGSRVENLDVALDGELRVGGGLAAMEEMDLSFHLEGAAFELDGLPVKLDPLEARLAAGVFTLEPLGLEARNARFELAGTADVPRDRLDLAARGELPLRTLNPFVDVAALSGRGQLELTLRGPLADPELSGRVAVADGTARLRVLDQGLSDIEAELVLEGGRLRVASGTARFGGGPITLTGGVELEGLLPGAVRLEMTGRELALRYPEGMNSRLDADLVLEGVGGDLRLAGSVTATRGLYDLDIALGSSVLAAEVEEEPSEVLRAIALQIEVDTERPVLVRNNLARLDARGRLTVRGSMDAPEPYGRLEILNGGKLFVRNREFVIESGSLVYNGDWNPSVSLTAQTQITDTQEGSRTYDVTVRASGPLEQLQLSFSSDPPESEAGVLTLIATGTTQGRGLAGGASMAGMAGEQLAGFLTSRLTGELARSLEQLGFDEVSIQPQLLAREEDPTARFTFGKQVLPATKLIYSIGLGGAEERFARLEVSPWRNFTGAVQRRDDGLTSFSVGQRLRFGEAVRRQRTSERERTRLEGVSLEGELPVAESVLLDTLQSHAGRRVTEWELQADAERLRSRLVERGYLEAQTSARLDERRAVFAVRPGPRYTWSVEGMTDPPPLDEEIREAFHEAEALQRGRDRLLRELRSRGHLRADVEADARAAGGDRHLVFEAQPGPVLEVERLVFPGSAAFSQGRLLDSAGGVSALLVEPERARERIAALYRSEHFLAAAVELPEVEEAGGRLRISMPVQEGPKARIASTRVTGAPEADPPPELDMAAGEPFSEGVALKAEARLREHYLDRGYPALRVRTRIQPAGDDLEVIFELTPGAAVRIGEIAVSGLKRTRESVVRGRLRFAEGDPLDPRDLVAAESRLLALGIFERVAVFADGNPATVTIEVAELPRFVAGYDIRYNDDEALSALLEGELGNVAGSGLSLGLRGRAGRDVREVRGSVFRPALVLGGDLTLSVFQREEDLDSGVEDAPDNLRRERGVELQQNLLLPNRWNLLYGYRFRRSTLFISATDADFTQNVAGISLGAFRDSRDNVLDPRHGRFYSLNLTLAPGFVGSTLPFVKGFAQASFVRPFSESLLWAHAYRLGLGRGLEGQPMPSFERFRAGGPNSLRGFDTNELGPRDFLGEPSGGEAVVIVNQELRWRHPPTGVGAVLFYDGGEVFERLGDIDLDLRHVIGVGLRYESPVGLLRIDWGFPLDPRDDERGSQLHFSLGQAF